MLASHVVSPAAVRPRRMRRRVARRVACFALGGAMSATATRASAQGPTQASGEAPLPLVVATTIDTAEHLAARSVLEFALNRPLAADEGELVMTVGGVDVTALAERAGLRLVYRPTFAPIPAGTTDIVVYRKRGAQWTELRRLTIKVLTATGFTHIAATPSATIGNKGQLAEGRSAGIAQPDRPTYQDLVLNGSLQTTHERSRFVVETSSSYVGSSRRQEALRFFQRQEAAPRLDLANYRVMVRAGGASLTLGNTMFGSSRHLINGFGSRGASLSWSQRGTHLSVGALNAAPMVGWDNLVGLNRANNRVFGASVGRELLPARPGAMKVDLTMLSASMLPLGGFRQGAVLDAEQSAGGAFQLAMATPGQRARFAGGISRSRFDNPPLDPQLTGDTTVQAVARDSRSARFVESSLGVLQNRSLPGLGAATLGVGYRHERVDPLYRSVTTPVQADRQNDAVDVTFSLGTVSGQFAGSWSRDNLSQVKTLLTTRSRGNSANLSVPMAQLVRATRTAPYWPMLSFSLNRLHQFGDGLPDGGVFRAQDVPDQISTNRDIGAHWQLGRLRVVARQNRSHQDNRQDSRQRADFRAGSDALSLGMALTARADVAVDIGDDFQRSEERDEQTDTKRITLNANVRRGQGTSLVLALSMLNTRPPTGPATLNSEQRAEFTQPLAFWKDATGGSRGQLFVRFARSTARLPDFLQVATNAMARVTQTQWAISSGFNLRVF